MKPIAPSFGGSTVPGTVDETGLDHAHHTTLGTVSNFAAEALSLPAGFLIVVFLSRQFGPELYGVFGVASAIVLFFEISVTNLFRAANVKFVAEAVDRRSVASAMAQMQFLVGLGAAALLIVLAPSIALWLRAEELTIYLRLFSLDIPLFALADAYRSALIGQSAFGRRALLTAIRWVIRVVLVFLFVAFGFSISGAILAIVGSVVIELIVARIFIPLTLMKRFTFPFRRLVGYALPLFLFGVTMRLLTQVDLLMVKALIESPEAAGFFSASQNLTMIGPALFFASISPVLLSALTQALRLGQVETVKAMTYHAMRFVLCLLPFGGIAAGIASEVIFLVYGPSFSPAASLVALLSFAALGVIMIAVTSTVLTAAGRPGLPFVLTAPLVPLALAAHLILVPRFGSLGAAAVTSFFAWLGALATMIAVQRHYGVFPAPMTMLRAVLTTGIVYLVSRVWQLSGEWILFEAAGLLAIIMISLTLFGEFTRDDLKFVQSLISRRE